MTSINTLGRKGSFVMILDPWLHAESIAYPSRCPQSVEPFDTPALQKKSSKHSSTAEKITVEDTLCEL